MLEELIVVSFATFIGWVIVRSFTPVELNARISPLLVIGIAYLMTLLDKPSVLIAFAAAGGVALLNTLTEASGIEPVKIPRVAVRIRRSNKRRNTSRPSSVGHRIPNL